MRVSILMLMLMLMCICMYFLLRSLADLHERRAARALEELLAHQQGGGGCDHHEHNDLRSARVHMCIGRCKSIHMYIKVCGI